MAVREVSSVTAATGHGQPLRGDTELPQVRTAHSHERTVPIAGSRIANGSTQPAPQYRPIRASSERPRPSITAREAAILVTSGVFMVSAIIQTLILAAEYAHATQKVRNSTMRIMLPILTGYIGTPRFKPLEILCHDRSPPWLGLSRMAFELNRY